jgi:hypothetical protein
MSGQQHDDADLVSPEGVDEGSAAATAETGPDDDAGVLGESPHGAPVDGAQAAGPVDTEPAEARTARAERGPGQQLAEGEG